MSYSKFCLEIMYKDDIKHTCCDDYAFGEHILILDPEGTTPRMYPLYTVLQVIVEGKDETHN